MRNFIFMLLLIPNFISAQDKEPKNIKDGWAIHLGAGFMYGGNIGFLAEKQILLKNKLRISPFGSFGIAEGGTDSTGSKYNWFGYAAGVNLEYGKTHRVIFGPHFTGENLIGNSDEVMQTSPFGASFIIGYKGVANFGLIWQVYIGDIYYPDLYLKSKEYSHSSHLGLGIGFKF